jgi:hypothetical protein
MVCGKGLEASGFASQLPLTAALSSRRERVNRSAGVAGRVDVVVDVDGSLACAQSNTEQGAQMLDEIITFLSHMPSFAISISNCDAINNSCISLKVKWRKRVLVESAHNRNFNDMQGQR